MKRDDPISHHRHGLCLGALGALGAPWGPAGTDLPAPGGVGLVRGGKAGAGHQSKLTTTSTPPPPTPTPGRDLLLLVVFVP